MQPQSTVIAQSCCMALFAFPRMRKAGSMQVFESHMLNSEVDEVASDRDVCCGGVPHWKWMNWFPGEAMGWMTGMVGGAESDACWTGPATTDGAGGIVAAARLSATEPARASSLSSRSRSFSPSKYCQTHGSGLHSIERRRPHCISSGLGCSAVFASPGRAGLVSVSRLPHFRPSVVSLECLPLSHVLCQLVYKILQTWVIERKVGCSRNRLQSVLRRMADVSHSGPWHSEGFCSARESHPAPSVTADTLYNGAAHQTTTT